MREAVPSLSNVSVLSINQLDEQLYPFTCPRSYCLYQQIWRSAVWQKCTEVSEAAEYSETPVPSPRPQNGTSDGTESFGQAVETDVLYSSVILNINLRKSKPSNN